jgi:hypothetical protein
MAMTAGDYLRSGYRERMKDLAKARQRELATLYRPNATYDRILARRAQEGDAFRRQLPTTTHIAVGHYVEQKAAYDAEQADQGDDTAGARRLSRQPPIGSRRLRRP